MSISSSTSRPVDPLRFCGTSSDVQHDLIARRAYFRAMCRDFEPGHELDDWLAAEAEVERETSVPWGLERS